MPPRPPIVRHDEVSQQGVKPWMSHGVKRQPSKDVVISEGLAIHPYRFEFIGTRAIGIAQS